MTYCVTGIRATPDVGFKSESRRTAEGAKACALDFLGDGLREVEVRDGSGNLRSLDELEGAADDVWDFGVADRLAAL